MSSPLASLRARLADLGEQGRARFALLRRVPPLHDLLEGAARVGYGARGFVYVSVGMIALLAALDRVGDAVGSRGAAAWLAEQDRLELLRIPEPEVAAEMFAGMVLGHGHLRAILGVAQPPIDLEARAAEAVHRFLRAFAR